MKHGPCHSIFQPTHKRRAARAGRVESSTPNQGWAISQPHKDGGGGVGVTVGAGGGVTVAVAARVKEVSVGVRWPRWVSVTLGCGVAVAVKLAVLVARGVFAIVGVCVQVAVLIGAFVLVGVLVFVDAGLAVTDILSISGAATVICQCGNIAANGGTLVSTYSKSLGAATNQTNTATATLTGVGYNRSAVAVTFSSTPTLEADEAASIDDPSFPGADQSNLTTSGSFTSTTQSFSRGNTTTITNTATLTEGYTLQTRTDSASLTVNCYGIRVAKMVNTSLTRTYSWTIPKSSTAPTALTLNFGQTYAHPYP